MDDNRGCCENHLAQGVVSRDRKGFPEGKIFNRDLKD